MVAVAAVAAVAVKEAVATGGFEAGGALPARASGMKSPWLGAWSSVGSGS